MCFVNMLTRGRFVAKGNRAQVTMKANMLFLHTLLTPGVGSKFLKKSESSHVAYQLK